MANASHSPGPWTLGQGFETARNHAVCSGPSIIAKVAGNGYPAGIGWSPETEANARLITAAPDMLAALQGVETEASTRLAWVAEHYEENAPERQLIEKLWRPIITAIAKAEGRE